MRNERSNKQPKTRRATDRDYVEALDYLAELSEDDQKYQDGDRDFVKAHFSFVMVK